MGVPNYPEMIENALTAIVGTRKQCQECPARFLRLAFRVKSAEELPEACCARPLVKARNNEHVGRKRL